ncbi:MAG: DNA sulfur modification protein DndB [Nitrospira sp.]|nr:DNA sulfur modification protein DndB [Nitrospira sp.]
MMEANFEYVFPTIRGVQAGAEHYVSMCPLRLIPRMFLFNEIEMVPELRAQRQLNRARLPEIARYITDNAADYVFSAITASVDGSVRFQAIGSGEKESRMGTLHIPMDARLIINDGQHRRAAIDMALQERPELGDESIAVVLFVDKGLKRSQQMFADLNKYAIRPSRSLGILYDHRDDRAELARLIVTRSPLFGAVVEMEKSNLAKRSRRLITLSAIYTAKSALLSGTELKAGDDRADRAIEYWTAVAEQFKEWALVQQNDLKASEVRQDYIHSHGVVLHALGRVGCSLFKHAPKDWRKRLRCLKSIDWRRANKKLWEGRAMVGGTVSKRQLHVTLTTNAIKAALALPLTEEEQATEAEFTGNANAKKA